MTTKYLRYKLHEAVIYLTSGWTLLFIVSLFNQEIPFVSELIRGMGKAFVCYVLYYIIIYLKNKYFNNKINS